MKLTHRRMRDALHAAVVHFSISLGITACVAILVFRVWYPYPYREMSGGWNLFFLVVVVDVVTGPVLTLVLFDNLKRKKELYRDLSLVVLIQLLSLAFGIYYVWAARPLYLVQEIDRFKVIIKTDLRPDDIKILPANLMIGLFSAPKIIAIRAPTSEAEREKVLFESVQGGRDYAERPEFYVEYKGEAARKSTLRALPLRTFLGGNPTQREFAEEISIKAQIKIDNLLYLPIIARGDWIAVIDIEGVIHGYLRGDGFLAK